MNGSRLNQMHPSRVAFRFLALAASLFPLAAQTASSQCTVNPALSDAASGPAWNGWGVDLSNSRFQTASAAQMTASQVPHLKLKWAFGVPGAKEVYGEPVVVAGRVFVSADTGAVYSLNADTGCVYWTFQAAAGVRNAVSIRSAKPSAVAYFGDLKANVYALDATKGTLIWKVHVDEHPTARITGAPKLYEDRVYVPVASSEEGASSGADYPCCSFRGSVVALDAASGKQLWKTWIITDAPEGGGKECQRREPLGASRWRRMEFANHRSQAPRTLCRHWRCVHYASGQKHRRHDGARSGFGQSSVVGASHRKRRLGGGLHERQAAGKLSQGFWPGSGLRLAAHSARPARWAHSADRRAEERQRVGLRSGQARRCGVAHGADQQHEGVRREDRLGSRG